MKETLTQQLEKANKEVEYYRGKYEAVNDELYSLKKKYDDRFANTITGFKEQNNQMFNANLQLQEIIRWHVNPESAKKTPPTIDRFGNIINY